MQWDYESLAGAERLPFTTLGVTRLADGPVIEYYSFDCSRVRLLVDSLESLRIDPTSRSGHILHRVVFAF